MKYLLIHAIDPAREVGADERSEMQATLEQWLAETRANGTHRHGARLADVRFGATVRVRAGERVVTEGPFADTNAQIARYDVIECPDLDQAIEIASRHPTLLVGAIELRPFWGG